MCLVSRNEKSHPDASRIDSPFGAIDELYKSNGADRSDNDTNYMARPEDVWFKQL